MLKGSDLEHKLVRDMLLFQISFIPEKKATKPQRGEKKGLHGKCSYIVLILVWTILGLFHSGYSGISLESNGAAIFFLNPFC